MMPPRARKHETRDSSSPDKIEVNDMVETLFGEPTFQVAKFAGLRKAAHVPDVVVKALKDAQKAGQYVYYPVADASRYNEMANVLRAAGDHLEQATVIVAPVIAEDGDFHRVSKPEDATHIKVTVGHRRGGSKKRETASGDTDSE
jgi:hypothetical protein